MFWHVEGILMAEHRFKTVKREGVTVVLVNKDRVLILRRIWLPFIVNPGFWYFVGGARKDNETPLQNAYREVEEEVGLKRKELKLVYSGRLVVVDKWWRQRWGNQFFIMRAAHQRIRLNLEHTGYRWVSFSALVDCSELLACLEDSKRALASIKSALH